MAFVIPKDCYISLAQIQNKALCCTKPKKGWMKGCLGESLAKLHRHYGGNLLGTNIPLIQKFQNKTHSEAIIFGNILFMIYPCVCKSSFCKKGEIPVH